MAELVVTVDNDSPPLGGSTAIHVSVTGLKDPHDVPIDFSASVGDTTLSGQAIIHRPGETAGTITAAPAPEGTLSNPSPGEFVWTDD